MTPDHKKKQRVSYQGNVFQSGAGTCLSIITGKNKTISLKSKLRCMGAIHERSQKPSATTWHKQNAKLTPEHLLVQHSFERRTKPDNLSEQNRGPGLKKREWCWIGDVLRMEPSAISTGIMNRKTLEKSKRNDRKKDGRSQLLRANFMRIRERLEDSGRVYCFRYVRLLLQITIVTICTFEKQNHWKCSLKRYREMIVGSREQFQFVCLVTLSKRKNWEQQKIFRVAVIGCELNWYRTIQSSV